MVTGIEANVAAWQHTRYGVLWRWMTWPLIRPIVELAYNRWARWRYDRLYKAEP
jgi:predicted DCC family thiol-disulfide oxidoreductase YuxK